MVSKKGHFEDVFLLQLIFTPTSNLFGPQVLYMDGQLLKWGIFWYHGTIFWLDYIASTFLWRSPDRIVLYSWDLVLDVHLVELFMMKNVWKYWLTQLSQPVLCTLNMLVWTDYKHNWTLMFWWQASIRCVSYVSLNKECSTFQYYIYLKFCTKAFAQR